MAPIFILDYIGIVFDEVFEFKKIAIAMVINTEVVRKVAENKNLDVKK